MAGTNPRTRDWVVSILATTVFCLAIAVATKLIWAGKWYEHIAISFGYGYCAVLSAFAISKMWPSFPLLRINGLSILFSFVFGTLNAYLVLSHYSAFSGFSDIVPVAFLGLVLTAGCFFYFYAYEQKMIAERELEIAKRKQSEQEKALILSQLKQLQSQIEPHFLFNTLANIQVLIDSEPTQAKQMLSKLTDLMRATLKTNTKELISLREELVLADAYLGIHQVRLGERLQYSIDYDTAIDQVQLPPFLVQPLVENAIQHGIEPNGAGGEIKIEATKQDGLIEIRVEDSGVGLEAPSSHNGHGVGLANIRQRLQAMFNDSASLSIVQNSLGGVTASIRIEDGHQAASPVP